MEVNDKYAALKKMLGGSDWDFYDEYLKDVSPEELIDFLSQNPDFLSEEIEQYEREIEEEQFSVPQEIVDEIWENLQKFIKEQREGN